MNISLRELSFFVESLRDFLKTFDKMSECLQLPLPKDKNETGYTKSKGNLFVYHYNSFNMQIEFFVYRSVFKTTILAFFPSKNLYLKVIRLYVQNLSTFTVATMNTSTKSDLRLQTSVK